MATLNPTMNQNIPTSKDHIAFEGHYAPDIGLPIAKEADSTRTAGDGTEYGPDRVVISALNGIIGPASAQPTTTTANTDTSWSFVQQVRHLIIQNNTVASIQFALDAAVSAGSLILAPGATFTADIRVTAVHLYAPGVYNINGSTAGNIVIWGWM